MCQPTAWASVAAAAFVGVGASGTLCFVYSWWKCIWSRNYRLWKSLNSGFCIACCQGNPSNHSITHRSNDLDTKSTKSSWSFGIFADGLDKRVGGIVWFSIFSVCSAPNKKISKASQCLIYYVQWVSLAFKAFVIRNLKAGDKKLSFILRRNSFNPSIPQSFPFSYHIFIHFMHTWCMCFFFALFDT